MATTTKQLNTKALPLTTVRHLNRTLPFDTGTAVKFVREIGLNKEDRVSESTEVQASSSQISGEEVRLTYESIINTVDEKDYSETTKSNTEHVSTSSRLRRKRKTRSNAKPSALPSKANLFKFAQNGHLHSLSQALTTGHYDINMTDQFDWTLLMTAATAGHMTTVQYLLENNAKWAGLTDRRDMDAVSLARCNGHHEIAEYISQYEENTINDIDQQVEDECVCTCTSGKDEGKGACSLFQRSSKDVSKEVCKLTKGESASKNEGHGIKRQRSSLERPQSPFRCTICNQVIHNTSSSIHSLSITHQFSCQHKPMSLPYTLSRTNKGFQMMLRSGWDPGQGLGSEGQGRKFPVKTVLKRDRAGIGVSGGASESRVTHFKPGDTAAILSTRERRKKNKEERPSTNKKEREKRIRKERRWEIRMRQYMSSGEH